MGGAATFFDQTATMLYTSGAMPDKRRESRFAMTNYMTTMPKREGSVVVSGARAEEDSGLVVVGVNNFDGDTFLFPTPKKLASPYAVITDTHGSVIRFSILQR
jgi:hypothetical protein